MLNWPRPENAAPEAVPQMVIDDPAGPDKVAQTVTGPVKENPRARRSRASAVDSGLEAGTSAMPTGPLPCPPDPRRSPTAARPGRPGRPAQPCGIGSMTAAILARFRMDAGVSAEPRGHVARAESGDDGGIEARERRPEVLPLAQDRQPGQAGLEGFQAEPLEDSPVVADRGPAPPTRRPSSR